MQCKALPSLPLCPLRTRLTLPLSHSCFQSWAFFSLHTALSVWMRLSVRYSWCLLFSPRQASQMASLKVLIDAQCLLIKKLLSLTTTAVHRDRHAHAAAWRQPRGRGLKGKKNDNINRGRCSISTEDKIKRQAAFARSLLLHAKWETKPRAWRSPPERTLPFLRLAWNKKNCKGVWSSYDFFPPVLPSRQLLWYWSRCRALQCF